MATQTASALQARNTATSTITAANDPLYTSGAQTGKHPPKTYTQPAANDSEYTAESARASRAAMRLGPIGVGFAIGVELGNRLYDLVFPHDPNASVMDQYVLPTSASSPTQHSGGGGMASTESGEATWQDVDGRICVGTTEEASTRLGLPTVPNSDPRLADAGRGVTVAATGEQGARPKQRSAGIGQEEPELDERAIKNARLAGSKTTVDNTPESIRERQFFDISLQKYSAQKYDRLSQLTIEELQAHHVPIRERADIPSKIAKKAQVADLKQGTNYARDLSIRAKSTYEIKSQDFAPRPTGEVQGVISPFRDQFLASPDAKTLLAEAEQCGYTVVVDPSIGAEISRNEGSASSDKVLRISPLASVSLFKHELRHAKDYHALLQTSEGLTGSPVKAFDTLMEKYGNSAPKGEGAEHGRQVDVSKLPGEIGSIIQDGLDLGRDLKATLETRAVREEVVYAFSQYDKAVAIGDHAGQQQWLAEALQSQHYALGYQLKGLQDWSAQLSKTIKDWERNGVPETIIKPSRQELARLSEETAKIDYWKKALQAATPANTNEEKLRKLLISSMRI